MIAPPHIASSEGRESPEGFSPEPQSLSTCRQQLRPWPEGDSRGRLSDRQSWRHCGFTLIELTIVLAIIAILASIAVPMYQRSVVRARESVLREDLFTLRNAIDQYTLDKQKAPQTLQDLSSAGYLKQIPTDPITRSNSTWVPEMEDALLSIDQQQPGIADVHSGSDQISSDGTAYNTW